jgi:CheY-like chemotaxis protein
MRDDLVSLRLLAVSAAAQDREVLRQGAGLVSVPVDVVEAANGSKSVEVLRNSDVDLILLDSALPDADKISVIEISRALAKPPFIILLVGVGGTIIKGADAVVAKPRNSDEAQNLVQRCMRVRVASRVLIVDDSSTMRSIVRKILTASNFPLDIVEVNEGTAALEMVRNGAIDVVFLDYNMPGLDGLATLKELKRMQPQLEVVLISSTDDKAVAERAVEEGAAAFLRKPFYPADIDGVLRAYYGLAPLS